MDLSRSRQPGDRRNRWKATLGVTGPAVLFFSPGGPSIRSVGASSKVRQAIGRTPEELRQDRLDAQSWTAVEDEARALLNGIVAGNLVRHYRIGKTALAVYSIATRLVQRQPEHSDLLPHVDTMKRLNRFGVKLAKLAAHKQAPAPTTTPTTVTQPTATPQQPKSESSTSGPDSVTSSDRIA